MYSNEAETADIYDGIKLKKNPLWSPWFINKYFSDVMVEALNISCGIQARYLTLSCVTLQFIVVFIHHKPKITVANLHLEWMWQKKKDTVIIKAVTWKIVLPSM